MSDQLVFSVGDEGFTWDDALLAALTWGDTAELEAEIREGIACIRHMLRSDRRPTEAEEDAAAAQFRTERNLITAAEAEAWLEQRHISVDNWLRCIRRSMLRTKWCGRLPRLVQRYPATSTQVRRALWTVGICSGWFYRFAWKLAGRAAIQAQLAEEPQTEDAGAQPAPVLTDRIANEWLQISAEARQAKLARLARLENSYRHFAERTATPDALRRQIAARHSDWICVNFSTHLFAREADAREALLCVREDGEPLAEVADRSRARTLRTRCFLEQLDPALRSLMLSSPPDAPLGPLEQRGESALLVIHEKVLPDAADPAIHALAEQAILSRLVNVEIERRVQWRAKF